MKEGIFDERRNKKVYFNNLSEFLGEAPPKQHANLMF